MRKATVLLLVTALFSTAHAAPSTPGDKGAADKPNIVLILADDVGWMDLAAYAARVRGVERSDCYYETPHLDQLADRGMLFTQAYSCALCSPARAALLTGQYPARHGFLTASGHTTGSYYSRKMTPPKGYHIHDRMENDARKTDPAVGFVGPSFTYVLQSGQAKDERDAITIAEALNGYRSAIIGKWHLGGLGVEGYQPGDQGFEEIAYFDHGGSPYFVWQNKWKGGGVSGEDLGFDYLTDDLTERAVRFMKECSEKEEPFFLYFPEFAVHAPREAKPEDIAYFETKANRGWNGHSMPEYAGVLRGLDNSVGRVVEALDELGIAENTLLIFMSDNGGIARANATSNLPLRAGKGSLYEGGVRVPFIACQPGTIKAGSVCDVAIDATDIFPTLMTLVGQGNELVTLDMDGQSILPLFSDPKNRKKQYTRDTFFWHAAGGGYNAKKDEYTPTKTSIRKGDYKLIFDDQGYLELYNISKDLPEEKNLAESMPEKAQELFGLLDTWLDETVPVKYQRLPNPLYDSAANAKTAVPPYRNLRNLPIPAATNTAPSKTGKLKDSVGAPNERVALWPEGKIPNYQPKQIAATGQEVKAKGFKAVENRMPHLDWYEPPARKNGGCMILVPGGGYHRCGGDWIDAVAKRFIEEGFVCVRLTYRTPRPKGLPIYQSAWEDGQRTVRLVRSEAQKRGFNPEKIGVMGASAGAHLTTLLATSSLTPAYDAIDQFDAIPSHINWAVLACPAYVLTDGLTGPNTRKGDAIDVKLSDAFKFDAKTCPMALFHGGTDPHSPSGSTQIYRQLRRMKIPAEIHLFADRGHVFWGEPNKGNDGAAYDHWIDRVCEFFRQMNYDGRLGAEEDLMTRYPNDDARGDYDKEPVWPEGRMPDVQKEQCQPYLEWHMPKERKTKAIQIIYSGGSYKGNNPDGFEVAPARRYLNAKGMTVVTMKYRTPRPQGGLAKHTTAWQDLQRAVRIVRNHAEEKGLDPDRIGIMGSSAGGHLTLMGATSSKHRSYGPIDQLDKLPCNVQWAVAIYPAYALTDGAGKPDIMGGNEDDARLVPEFSFDLATCPVLFIHGDSDKVATMNSVKCWEQLRRMGIQSDLHTLATRDHCFQRKAAPGTGSYTWMDRIWEFMNHKGYNRVEL